MKSTIVIVYCLPVANGDGDGDGAGAASTAIKRDKQKRTVHKPTVFPPYIIIYI